MEKNMQDEEKTKALAARRARRIAREPDFATYQRTSLNPPDHLLDEPMKLMIEFYETNEELVWAKCVYFNSSFEVTLAALSDQDADEHRITIWRMDSGQLINGRPIFTYYGRVEGGWDKNGYYLGHDNM
jgi:hypothetical protein